MAGPTTLFQTGTHGSRPAASAGCVLYWCTTHSIFYRSDGSAWANLQDLSAVVAAAGTLTTVKDEGTNLSTAVASIDFVGAGVTATGTTAVTVTIPGGVTRSTVGTTSAGASFATARGTYIKKVTLATAGLVASVHGFVKGNAANGLLMTAGILSDNSGAPLSVIAVGSATYVESSSGALVNLGLSTTVRDLSVGMGRWLAAGDYWIGIGMEAAADSRLQLAYNAGSGSDRKFTGSSGGYFADESFQTYGSSDTNDYCIYADIIT